MPLNISSDAIIEKNRITNDNTWLLLLKITYPTETPMYICLNNEVITWPETTGDEYLPAIFSLSGLSETKDAEVPSVTLNVLDINRVLIPF